MKNYLLISVLLICLPLAQAMAQEAETPAPANADSTLNLSLNGSNEFRYSLPVGDLSWPSGYQGSMKMPRLINEIGVTATMGQIKLVSNWEILNSGTTPQINNQENYLSWNPDFFRLGFGYQIFSWGSADGRNPTDNLNPRDYTTLEGSKIPKLPVLSASLTWYPSDSFSVETVFVPLPSNSRFPLDYATQLQAQGLTASYATMAADLSNFIAGGKINFRSTAIDLSASYLYDFDTMYTPDVSPTFSIQLERKRIHRLGADLKTTLDRFGLWAEGAYSFGSNWNPADYTERLARIDYTVGIDFSYGPEDSFYMNFQYTGTIVPQYDYSANTFSNFDPRYLEKSLVYSMAGIQEKVSQGITWNTRWGFLGDKLTLSFSGSYSLPFLYDDSQKVRYGSLLLRPEIDFMPFDSFHIALGGVLAYSWVKVGNNGVTQDTNDSMGVYTPQNHLYLSVSYKWNIALTK